MNKKDKMKGKFKSRGEAILNSTHELPSNMDQFLKDSEDKETSNFSQQDHHVQKHNYASGQKFLSAKGVDTQNDKCSSLKMQTHEESFSEEIVRLHVHIRKDLADKLLEVVFKRKQNRSVQQKGATQRMVIEQALESYFETNS